MSALKTSHCVCAWSAATQDGHLVLHRCAFLAAILLAAILSASGNAFGETKAPEGEIAATAGDNPPVVTNVWVDADLRAVLRDISAQTEITIIVDNGIDGAISMEVENMPVEQCLSRIAQTGPYACKKVEDYYIFGSTAPGSRLVDILGRNARIKLNYATAAEVHSCLPRSLTQYVQVGKESNTLSVTAAEPIFTSIVERIRQLDVPPKQVLVEALVVQLSEKGRKEFGTDWKWQNDNFATEFHTLTGAFAYNESSKLAKGIGLTLKALVREDKAKILASPRLAVLDRQKASMHVGEEKYYTLLSGYTDRPYYTLQSIKAGVTLNVTPYIGDNGDITMDIEPEVSAVTDSWDANGSNLPVINRRTAKTTVRVTDGQTIVIGGLLHEGKTDIKQKVPILGDIPLLGLLFKATKTVTEQTEAIIFITPRLISDEYARKSGEEKDMYEPMTENEKMR